MSSLTMLSIGSRMLAEDDHAGHDHSDHGKDKNDDDEGLSVDGFKWIMLVCMFLCVGFGIIPKVWKKCAE